MKLTTCSVYLQDEKASFDVIDNDTIPTPANKSYPLYGWVIVNLSNRPFVYFLWVYIGAVASWLVRSFLDRVVWVQALAGDTVLCSWARHLGKTLSQCLSPPRSLNGYRRIVGGNLINCSAEE